MLMPNTFMWTVVDKRKRYGKAQLRVGFEPWSIRSIASKLLELPPLPVDGFTT